MAKRTYTKRAPVVERFNRKQEVTPAEAFAIAKTIAAGAKLKDVAKKWDRDPGQLSQWLSRYGYSVRQIKREGVVRSRYGLK